MRHGRVHGAPALRIVGRVFMTLGIAGLVAALALALIERRSGRDAHADGIVVSSAYQRGTVVRFQPEGGEAVEFRTATWSSFWHQGDHVLVAYRPNDPTDARVESVMGRWLFAGLAGILGGVFVLIGIVLFRAGRRSAGGWAMPPP